MTVRGIIWAVLLSLAGILSAGVTLFGIWAAISVDLRQDTLLSGLYGGLPLLCFPVFLLVRPPRRSAVLLSLMALLIWARTPRSIGAPAPSLAIAIASR